MPPDLRKPLRSEARFVGRLPAYPTGSAVCEVEIDADTGVVEIVRYSSVDDAGQVINPLVVHGQTHGGIVQGAGQALSEAVVHDPDSGQVLSASFMDYAMLRADQMPSFNIEMVEDPIANNKLSEAFLKAVEYYRLNGDNGLREFVARELDDAEAYVRRLIARNVLDKM